MHLPWAVFGAFWLVVSLVALDGVRKAQRLDLDLSIALPARVASAGSCKETGGRSRRDPQGVHVPSLPYHYEYAGVRYRSDQVFRWSGDGFASREECLAFIDRRPVGATLRAWIDSRHPEQPVLDRTERRSLMPRIGIWLSVALLAGWLVSNRRGLKALLR